MARRSFGSIVRKGPRPAEGEEDLRPIFARYPQGRTPSGRTAYVVRKCDSEREARRFLAEVRRAQLSGTLAAPVPKEERAAAGITVGEALLEYVEVKRAEGAAASTVRHYGAVASRVAASGLGAKVAAEASHRDVEGFLRWRSEHGGAGEAGPAPATVGLDLAVLSAAFGRLVHLGTLQANPCARVKRPKGRQGTRLAFTAKEAEALVRACAPSIRALVVAALSTGMRFSELAALRWGDLLLEKDRGTARITRTKNRTTAAIPLHAAAVSELLAHRSRQAAASGVPGAQDFVFPSPAGGARRSPGTAWATALRAAGLAGRPGVCFHSLRHTFADAYLAEGGNVRDLQHLLGHSSLNITERYAKASDSRVREGVLRLSIPTASVAPLREIERTQSVPRTGSDGLPAIVDRAPNWRNPLPSSGDTPVLPPALAAG